MNWMKLISFFVIYQTTTLLVNASLGDRTIIYQDCLKSCIKKSCTKQKHLKKFYREQPLSEWMLSWSCENECSYKCMWQTVDAFIHHNVSVPQFHGKWPFVRVYGIQEPASMIFSVLNGIAHLIGVCVYMSKISPSNPIYRASVGFGVLAVNVWMCSTVFHTRDFPLTEKLDYFCATAAVLYSLYFCIHRMSMGLDDIPDLKRGNQIRTAAFVSIFFFFICHVCYLSFVKFDYGYNLYMNIVAGLSNGSIWLFYHWKTRHIYNHQWKATLAICCSTALINLELMDFPPIWWTLDAHSIWHAATIPFPILWYSFLIDESLMLDSKSKLT